MIAEADLFAVALEITERRTMNDPHTVRIDHACILWFSNLHDNFPKGRENQLTKVGLDSKNMYKPKLDLAAVTSFLEMRSTAPVFNVRHIDAGLVSTIFSYDLSDHPSEQHERFIAKFSSHENKGGLDKGRFISQMMAGSAIPVPEHVAYGETELPVGNLTPHDRELFSADAFPLTFSISRFIEGKQFPDLQNSSASHWIPIAVDTISEISSVDVSSTTGWGWFNGDGSARHQSWKEHLLASCFDKRLSRLYNQHTERFTDGFLEVSTLKHFSDRLRHAVEQLPEVSRSLVHTDFGWDNALVDDNQVVAIIDWDNAVFGDELYDLARLGVYAPAIDLRNTAKLRLEDQGKHFTCFDERWLACEIHMVLDTLSWYGWSNNPAAYQWMKARGLELTGDGPAVEISHPDSKY